MKWKILLIEDTEDLGEMICDILAMEGFEIIWAKDGRMGIDFFHTQKPDLIITDMIMPVLSGLEAIKYIRAEAASSIPIIILSARSSPEDQKSGLDAGASLYLRKPCSNSLLVESVWKLLPSG
ncbi:MAG: response regulator [Bacteroidetes bacterium]|nr:response regulator [Bacteroidota bacterium]